MTIEDLLVDITPGTARALAIEAVREWKHQNRSEREVTMNGVLGPGVLRLLSTKKGHATPPERSLADAFYYRQHEPLLLPFTEFAWWLVRLGLAVPGASHLPAVGAPPYTGQLASLFLTDTGDRFFLQAEDHPLLPGYLARLEQRCKGIPEEVVTYLGDANDCLDRGLPAPSVILAGIALEKMADSLWDVLHRDAPDGPGKTKKPEKAAELLRRLRSKIEHLDLSQADKQLVTAAVDFADHLRDRRNAAAHGKQRTFDTLEVEQLLVSAGRHVVVLWRATQENFGSERPATPPT